MGDEELPKKNLPSELNGVASENDVSAPKKQRNFRALLAKPKLVVEPSSSVQVSKKDLLDLNKVKVKEKTRMLFLKGTPVKPRLCLEILLGTHKY